MSGIQGVHVEPTIEQLHLDHPNFRVTKYRVRDPKGRFMRMYHVDHLPSKLGTAMDSWSLGGVEWCIEHFEDIKREGRYWTPGAFTQPRSDS